MPRAEEALLASALGDGSGGAGSALRPSVTGLVSLRRTFARGRAEAARAQPRPSQAERFETVSLEGWRTPSWASARLMALAP